MIRGKFQQPLKPPTTKLMHLYISGVILYMLVCGIAPFNEANDSETLTNIMDCRYKVLDHVSSSCQDLIQRMLIR